jgi:hypothetical protein
MLEAVKLWQTARIMIRVALLILLLVMGASSHGAPVEPPPVGMPNAMNTDGYLPVISLPTENDAIEPSARLAQMLATPCKVPFSAI